jgi:hypothetical protein
MVAAACALIAAERLLLSGRHVRRDTEWLARRFGDDPDNRVIAELYNTAVAAILALFALSLVWRLPVS